MLNLPDGAWERLENGLWRHPRHENLFYFFCCYSWRPVSPNEIEKHSKNCPYLGGRACIQKYEYPNNERQLIGISKRSLRRRKRKQQLEWSRTYFRVHKEGGAYRKILLKALPLVLTRIAYAKLEEALNDTLWREQREFKEWKSKHPYTLTEWMPIGIYGLYKPESK